MEFLPLHIVQLFCLVIIQQTIRWNLELHKLHKIMTNQQICDIIWQTWFTINDFIPSSNFVWILSISFIHKKNLIFKKELFQKYSKQIAKLFITLGHSKVFNIWWWHNKMLLNSKCKNNVTISRGEVTKNVNSRFQLSSQLYQLNNNINNTPSKFWIWRCNEAVWWYILLQIKLYAAVVIYALAKFIVAQLLVSLEF